MKKSMLASLLFGTFLLNSAPTYAHSGQVNIDSCDIKLNHDLSISPDHIRVIEDSQTVIDIYQDNMVFYKGNEVELTPSQQQIVVEYSKAIRSSIPEVVDIAVDAIGIAYDAIEVSLGRFGDLSDNKVKFEEMQRLIKEKYHSQNGHFNFKNGDLNIDIEENGELEHLIEEVVEDALPSIIGGVLANIGSAIASGDTEFSDLDRLGDDIDKEIELRAEEIEIKADAFCHNIKAVDDMEEKLVAMDTRFQYLDVLTVTKK
jgi:hypothetical protein